MHPPAALSRAPPPALEIHRSLGPPLHPLRCSVTFSIAFPLTADKGKPKLYLSPPSGEDSRQSSMGCGKSVAASQPSAGATDAAKDITEESATEDHQKRRDGRRKVEVKSFAECSPKKHQLSSKHTICVRSYGGVYVGLPTDAATLAFSQKKVGQKSGK